MLNKIMSGMLYNAYSSTNAGNQTVQVRKGLGQPWQTINIRALLGEGATDQQINDYFQKMANEADDFISVRLPDGKKSTWGPAEKKISPETSKAPAEASSVVSGGPAPSAPQSAEGGSFNPIFMPPGQLKKEFEAQQARLKAGTRERTPSAATTDHPETTYTPEPKSSAAGSTTYDSSRPAWENYRNSLGFFGRIAWTIRHPLPGLEERVNQSHPKGNPNWYLT